jgi:Uncharacterized conserved protein
MKKRLALFFDGTWNTPESGTNVSKLCEAVAPRGADGIEQRVFYHTGVGTSWHGKLIGGAFGYGLSEIIRNGYRWLSENYAENDEIFVFGFSRGAYTARSLVGLVRKCGVLKSPTRELIQQAYSIYRRRDDTADSPEAQTFRDAHSTLPRVRFIGVWDTVGSLGVPLTGLKLAPFREYYKFHDTSLSKIVDYAYHAVAIDEHREDYAPTLWTEVKPGNRAVEQRWFIGAHCNVGGGYRDDRLYLLPLAWLQQKAMDAGLAMQTTFRPSGDEWRTAPRNSFREFMGGLYALVKRKPYNRTVGRSCNETIDPSVWTRVLAADLGTRYEPVPLAGIPHGTLTLGTTQESMVA